MATSQMPVPPALPGVTWRPARMTDAEGLAALAGAIDEAERLDHVGGTEFWTWWLQRWGALPDG